MNQILISGCTRGLGRELMVQYLTAEWIVYPIVRSRAPIEDCITRYGEVLRPIVCDITQPSASSEIERSLREHDATLAVLINNAGMGGGGSLLSEIELPLLSTMLETHCVGAIRVTQASHSYLREGESKVVNISSRLGSASRNARGDFANRGFSYSYRISKSAQNMTTLCMAQDEAFAGMIVCAIHPGRLKTASGASDADTDPAVAAQRLKERIDGLSTSDNGAYIDLEGGTIPW